MRILPVHKDFPMFSMTAFGSARVTTPAGSVTVEIRSVNNRFLELTLRLPDELRGLETGLRAQISQVVKRGKVDMRLQATPADAGAARTLDLQAVGHVATLLRQAREVLPDTPAPALEELLRAASAHSANDGAARLSLQVWEPLCLQASAQALQALQQHRQREGERLAQTMLAQAREISAIVERVAARQPELLAEHREKIVRKLRDALQAVSPDGFAHISGAELSARIAQESLLFSLRVDIAEELTRLRAHGEELHGILAGGAPDASGAGGSIGKRLDFLFQEMNREANTLGSKSASVLVTRAAMELKLLIEQLREQAQNIA